jgi:hypothetical protein
MNEAIIVKSLELHLKKVVINGYCGMKPDVEFAKLFVLNTKVLRKMILGLANRWDVVLHAYPHPDSFFTIKIILRK